MPKKTFTYSKENLDAAIKTVNNNGTSKKETVSKFNIPRRTIQFRMKNSYIVHFKNKFK